MLHSTNPKSSFNLGQIYSLILASFFDVLMSYLMCWPEPFFRNGWGNLSLNRSSTSRLANEQIQTKEKPDAIEEQEKVTFLPPDTRLSVKWIGEWTIEKTIMHRVASFETPVAKEFPEELPHQSRNAYFQVVLPSSFASSPLNDAGFPNAAENYPMVLQLPSTGDHYFLWRRIAMAKPLIQKHGIGSVILQIPYYGKRNPTYLNGITRVKDLYIMGWGTIEEGRFLLHWLREKGMKGQLGVTGISLGAVMATMVGSVVDFPIAITTIMPTSTPSAVFVNGMMSKTVDFRKLGSLLGPKTTLAETKKQLTQWLDKFQLSPEYWNLDANHRASYVQVSATHDLFIPQPDTIHVWKTFAANEQVITEKEGIRWVKGGHISAVFFERKEFHDAIRKSFDLLGQSA